ncbi:YeiH family protein [Neomicrococcus lactis]|uniref:YeiH family protein n=1 Tax=Neomicrococcus lactis TaxID=732241 RepID=UPI002301310A|nr:putative sulfate exporter family transporter [Neomicrococcus lactis]
MHQNVPGVIAAAVGVTCAFLVHQLVPAIPAMTWCVIVGMLASNVMALVPANLRFRDLLTPGMSFSGKRLMRWGIVFLGFQLVFADIVQLGWLSVALIVALVAVAFGLTYGISKLFRLPGDEPFLLASGFAICGASAIGAVSHARGTEKDAPLPVGLVTLCGTLAIFVLPALNGFLGLSPQEFGWWAGASVHDVGQVVATGATLGSVALSTAVVVKLVRVLTLAPVATLAALSVRRRSSTHASAATSSGAGKMPPLVPLFIAGFVAAFAARSLGLVPEAALPFLKIVQEVLLGSALVGLGFGINFRTLFTSGAKSTAAALTAWCALMVVSLGALRLVFPN